MQHEITGGKRPTIRKTIAFLTDELPILGRAGHSTYNRRILQYLEKAGHEVHIVLTQPRFHSLCLNLAEHYDSPYTHLHAAGCIRYGEYYVLASPQEVFRYLTRRLIIALKAFRVLKFFRRVRHKDRVVGTSRFETGVRAMRSATTLERIRPDLIFVDRIYRAPVLDKIASPAKKVLLAHDVLHKRHESLNRIGYQVQPTPLTREQEQSMLRRFDAILAIQPDEARTFAEMVDDCEVILVPMACRPHPQLHDSHGHMRCIFVGYDGAHNADALHWLLDPIWPEIISKLPDCKLHVYGSVGRRAVNPPKSVIIHGHVADLSIAYKGAAVALAPIRAGSGLSIKMIEYLAQGMACVATSQAAAGLLKDDQLPCVVADDVNSFACAVCKLLTDPEANSAMRRRALSYVEKLYAPERVFRPLTKWIADTAAQASDASAPSRPKQWV